MTAVKTKLLIFGGGDGSHYLNDLHMLDTETMSWSHAYVAGTSPAARSRHTTTLIGSRLFVFGGGDETRVYNDLYILDTDTMSWSRPDVKGTGPSARWGHTTTSIDDGKLLVFGGHDGTQMLNDIHVLDIQTMSWTQIQPKPLEEEPAKADNNNNNSSPKAPPTHPYQFGPTPRAGHTATLVENKLLLFGGGDGEKILNDIWFLELSDYTWWHPQVSGNAPAGRCAHTSTLLNNKLIVYGGGDAQRRFKDLYILDIVPVLKAEEARRNKLKKNSLTTSGKKKSNEEPIDTSKAKDISAWLAQLGLKQYTEAFVQNNIEMDSLSYLTEDHLEKLGISSLGHRIKIMKQINLEKQKHQQTQNNTNQLAQQQWIDAFKHHSQQMVDLLKQQFQQQLYLQQQIMDTFRMQQDQLGEFRKELDRVKQRIVSETGKLKNLVPIRAEAASNRTENANQTRETCTTKIKTPQ
eukprot:CAMPEP_0168555454 /NCGR_PEP_ID=MMETSP0413-20121227/8345_1 /TAXON_ID=136452 /ORGANISM="Filamoeba nolandi, Strain NC-AS-23-1" /LENGTH=463 /DNA_ID=CAMNT_0008586309 /DNA_START=416 /DNA_END=1805 /DNA_ORIENTATION=+